MDDTRKAFRGGPPRSDAPARRGPARPGRPRQRTLDDLRPLVKRGAYRLGPHAVQHAACEGFGERDVVGALLYGRELMRYREDERLLALGWIRPSPAVEIPLHVVVEFSRPRRVDVVTAFIPVDPHRVISRARLAEVLRYDRHEVSSRVTGKGK